MREPKKCCCENCNREELDFLSEECFVLAKDIIDIDEDIEGLADWTEGMATQYNAALDTIDYNFDVVAGDIEELQEKHNLLADLVLDKEVWLKIIGIVAGVNIVLTLLMLINVL